MSIDVDLVESAHEGSLGGGVEIGHEAVDLLVEPFLGIGKEGGAGIVGQKLPRLNGVEVAHTLEEGTLKLVLVNLLRSDAHLN